MKKSMIFMCVIILILGMSWPGKAEGVWTQNVSHGTQFVFNGELITITHTTIRDGLDYMEQTFTPIQEVSFEFNVKIGAENNDSESLVIESNGGNSGGGLWLYFNQNGLYDRDSSHPITTVPFNQWAHFRIDSTRDKISVYMNGHLKYERAGTFQPRSYVRFRDMGHCGGAVTNYLNNIQIIPAGSVGAHGTEFITSNNQIKIIHSNVDYGFDYQMMSFPVRQDVTIDFDAKIGSANNDNFSLLMDFDGEEASDGLRLAFNQNKLCYWENNQWREIGAVEFDRWTHYRVVSTLHDIEIYVNNDFKYSATGTFRSRSYVKFKDFGLCSGSVINTISNFQTKSATSGDFIISTDDFNYGTLTGWVSTISHGTQFSQSANTIRVTHSTATNGFDNIQQNFSALPEAVFEFDAKLGQENNDDFTLLFESDGGYAANDGLGLAFKANQVMVYEDGAWKSIFTAPFNQWRHYRVVSTTKFIAIFINDDFEYKRNGNFPSRSFMKFSDFGHCSGTVVSFLANIRVRPVTEDDRFIMYADFNNTELAGWQQTATHGTQFSQSSNGIRIIHSTTPNGFDNIKQTFGALREAVFEFDAKLGAENNTDFSLLVESDGGYAAPGGLGLAFKANQVMTYVNGVWQTIFTVPFNEWRHYRLVSTLTWIAIYVNDDLKYKRSGNFPARTFLKFSDFGMCGGAVTNTIANIQIRPATVNEKFILFEDFDNQPLTGWIQNVTHGTGFTQYSGPRPQGIRIVHSLIPNGLDSIKKTFTALSETVIEFDAKLGAENNDNFSLLLQSDGGYQASDGLGLAFKANQVMIYAGYEWKAIATVPFNEWRRYRIVSTPQWLAIYLNDDLKYKVNGSFRSRSFINFSDFGLCSGVVVSYLANVRIRAANDNDKFILFDDFNTGSLAGWSFNTPDGTQFEPENGAVKITHATGVSQNDYWQRNFDPTQNVVLEFDAKIGSENNSGYSLLLESDDTPVNGYNLSFWQNKLYTYSGSTLVGDFDFDQWNHYRVVYSATKIEVYINGELKNTATGVYGLRSYIRFSNAGNGGITNYLDNILIRPFVPEANNDNPNLPAWNGPWTTKSSEGTQFIEMNNTVTIHHALGAQGTDYYQRSFKPLQNVAFEFDAKFSPEDNTNWNLIVESDGDSYEGGLCLAFDQNTLYGYFFSGWQPIQTVDFNVWNRYRIVSTLHKIQVYINGILKYTYAGTFNPRSFLRFRNWGLCAPTNYLRNISIQEALPEPTISNQPDWAGDWLIHNPDGTQFIRENNQVKILHVAGTSRNDYLQRNFDPTQNVVLEFDAKIGAENNGRYSMYLESDDTPTNGYNLSFWQNGLYTYSGDILVGNFNYDQWNHFRVVYSATKIEVYINGELRNTVSGNFGLRSYIRFSNAGYGGITNYLDNILIRPLISEVSNLSSFPQWISDWTAHTTEGTQFVEAGNLVTIHHALGTQGTDYYQRSFKPMQNVAFQFDAKLSSEDNTSWNLIVESDGDYYEGGLCLTFYQNTLYGYFFSGWQPIQTVDFNVWNHYRIVSTLNKIQVYVNNILKYTYTGTFNPRSFLRFRNWGLCAPTNYLRNISIQEVIPEAAISNQPDWAADWLIHNPDGTQFIRENNQVKILHAAGTPRNDYLQRNFDPAQNVVLEFDAKIGAENNGWYSMYLESDDTPANGYYLSFWENGLYTNSDSTLVGNFDFDQWNHYRVVYSATKIEVYINGELKNTTTGVFGPRSYIRFSNAGYGGITNYLDNILIRPLLPEANNDQLPAWTSNWITYNPEGTRFSRTDELVTIHHKIGTQGLDYYQRSFEALQNVAFEFDAKLSPAGNTNWNLIIESDGGSYQAGLYMAFYQNTLEGYSLSGWQPIQMADYNVWNHYRIVSTLHKVQVYVNGVLKYTQAGTFNPRSYLRFRNWGLCAPTNYLRDITISPIVPDATFTSAPDWAQDWVIHNPEGSEYSRENDVIKISQSSPGTEKADYLQRNFAPRESVVLEFEAKIGSENNYGNALFLETDDAWAGGFYLSFNQDSLYAYNGITQIATVGCDTWNAYQVVCTPTQIQVFVNGVLKYTTNGIFSPRSFFRFSGSGAAGITNYLDNVCIREYQLEPLATHPAGLPADWIVYNPDGTDFSADGDVIKIGHALGTWGNDYIQRNFVPVQNVVFEFDAKLGGLNNSNQSLLVESDEGTGSGGLFLAFNQNSLEGYFGGGWTLVDTVAYDTWNSYRIISTATEVQVYVNGELKQTFPGSFNLRSYLRFSNAGYCNPTNYIANVRVTPLIDWEDDWYFENLDTDKPLFVDLLPLDNDRLNTPLVTVSGKIADASPVTVTVNGNPVMLTHNSFSTQVAASEGWNTITITATDTAANTDSIARQVFIDSVPPAEFTPVADVSGWTQNNHPVITFGTTDSGSGMDHYEIRAGNGPWVTGVTSPYPFVWPVADGEQTITVKAVDAAGNIQLGTVTVYIDTTPPEAPGEFEVISGVNRVILKWKDALGDVLGYRIERTPVFEGESFREIWRSEIASDLSQWIDEAVVDGAIYSYTIAAIDRAGNVGQVSQGAEVTVGIAEKPVSVAGATVKFDNCAVTLTKDSIVETGTVVIEENTEPLPVNSFATAVGRAYDFTLENGSGEPVKAEFAAPVSLTISYAGVQLPEGYDPGDLGIYWYNENTAGWEKLEGAVFDFLKQTVTVPLSHFSTYQAMASQYVTPSLQSYYDLGVSPYGSYFQDNVESVSPASGVLSISATDLKLPGPNGFDLVVKRFYESTAAQQRAVSSINGQPSNIPIDTFSPGWSLNIPWVEWTPNGGFLRLPEGQTIKIKWVNGKFEYHQGIHFTLYKIALPGINYNPLLSPHLAELIQRLPGAGYLLYLNDGTKYVFDSSGKVTEQVDSTGHFHIQYHYSGRQLTEIIDAAGRTVSFHYGTNGYIDSMTTGARTWSYIYAGDLKEAYDPLGRKTEYQYETKSLTTGGSFYRYYENYPIDIDHGGAQNGYGYTQITDINKIYGYGCPILKRIIYPTGVVSSYVISLLDQGGSTSWDENSTSYSSSSKTIDWGHATSCGQKIVISSHTLLGKSTEYTYFMNVSAGSLRCGSFVGPNTYMDSCRVEESVGGVVVKSSKMTYQHLIYSNKYELKDANQTVIYFSSSNPQWDPEDYRGQLAKSQVTLVNGLEQDKITFEYNPSIQAVTKEIHFRLGMRVYEVGMNYDGWGNITYRYDGSTKLEESWEYVSHPTIHNLLGVKVQTNQKPYGGSSVVRTVYEYNPDGQPEHVTVNSGTTSQATAFSYYENGLLMTRTEDNGLVTRMAYDSHLTPASKTVDEVAGVVADNIITYYQYDAATGMKLSETDPRGNTTHYEYDLLNRITRVVLPTENGVTPERSYLFDDVNNTCRYTNENGQQTLFRFDGLGRLTDIVKNPKTTTLNPDIENVTTVYHYDAMGRIDTVTDPKGYVTTYTYDALNRVKTVAFPQSNNSSDSKKLVVTFDYYDATNMVEVIEHENTATGTVIGRTKEQSDWANRLVNAVQEIRYNGVKEADGNWSFGYDSLGNKLWQIDPLNYQTHQTFDGLGRMTQIVAPDTPFMIGNFRYDINPELKYEYDNMGNKTAEIDAKGNRKDFGYDLLGRLVQTTVAVTDIVTHNSETAVTTNFYDKAGNKVKVRDANGKDWTYTYSARGYLLRETDPLGHQTRFEYDAMGNKTAVIDPMNRRTEYQYDGFNRLKKTILPDGSYTEITYDANGNKLTERDVTGLVTAYTYTPRNFVETVTVGGQLRASYTYDAKGNAVEVKDALNNVTRSEYDSLGRLRKVTHPSGITEKYKYDKVGNKLEATDGRGNSAKYGYNPLGWLTLMTDPLGKETQYYYDLNGNQIKKTAANGLVTTFHYDELNRLDEKIDSLGNLTRYRYDLAGNRTRMVDPRGSNWVYQYLDNNLLERIDVTGTDSSTYWVRYTYDAAGNRTRVEDPGNINNYVYDNLNRLTGVERNFDSKTYTTGYQYTNGLLTGILYPGASGWLNYNYNGLNQLNEVVGFTQPDGIQYMADGALQSMTYANGVATSYTYDNDRRLSSVTAGSGGTNILSLSYGYDNSGNITTFNDRIYDSSGNITKNNDKTYEYDANNQLKKAVTIGKFMESKVTPGETGFTQGDFAGTAGLELGLNQTADVYLDYNASSIGIKFINGASKVKRILLVPGAGRENHRITPGTFDLFWADNDQSYHRIAREDWEYQRDSNGVITLTLKQAMAMKYLKIHVYYDERNSDFVFLRVSATFLNQLGKMLQVYQEADRRTEDYFYDCVGNRTLERVTLIQASNYYSYYYANSDHLKTDGKFAFKYDVAGNLITKGNKYTISGDTVTFTATSGAGVEYWQYKYDLLNRLVEVKKNGTLISEYEYDPEGLRVVKRANGETVHYVFEGTEPIFEKNVTTDAKKSYVYAYGKHIARVDNAIGLEAEKYWYTTDHLGSVRVITDVEGAKVWDADYFAFGQQYGKNKIDAGFEEDEFGFTGKGYDEDVGLYYFNARWYDADTGRFISEDPAQDGNNWYVYGANNPLMNIDPTGLVSSKIYIDGPADYEQDFTDTTLTTDGNGTITSTTTYTNSIGGSTVVTQTDHYNTTTGKYQGSTTSISITSPVWMRWLVPGQVAWDDALTNFANGQYVWGIVFTGQMVAEDLLFVLSFGNFKGFGGLGAATSSSFKFIPEVLDSQIGKKLVDHAADYGLTISKEGAAAYKQITMTILKNVEQIRVGTWKTLGNCEFWIRGTDVVIVKNGVWVSTFPLTNPGTVNYIMNLPLK